MALPVSVEQIAAVVKQVDRLDQQRLLELAPELRALSMTQQPRTEEQMRESIRLLQAEVMAAANHQTLATDAPFLGNMTLAQYDASSDAEKTLLWDKWSDCDLMDLNEEEAAIDTLPA